MLVHIISFPHPSNHVTFSPPHLALSFLLPLIVRLVNTGVQQAHGSPRVLVLAPTRELCMQIEDQAKQLMQGQLLHDP